MPQTTNYHLPTFGATDAVNLLTTYNTAMTTIDSQMKDNATAASNAASAAQAAQQAASAANSAAQAAQADADANATAITALDTRIDNLENGEFNPNPSTDAIFDVTKLGQAKIDSNGIVYFKAV